MHQASYSADLPSYLEISHAKHTCLAHKQFILAYETASLGFLISIPKALGILMVHKIRDDRFQSLLVKCASTLLALLVAAYCGFHLMPLFLAVGMLALGAFLLASLLWLEAGDILLKFALEDQQFFELATRHRVLSVLEDPELTLPQPTTVSPQPAGRI